MRGQLFGVPRAHTDPRAAVLERRSADLPEPVPGAPLPAEQAAFLDEFIRTREAAWIDESIPALGGLTPRQALDDPTRREDLLSLLREMDTGPGTLKRTCSTP